MKKATLLLVLVPGLASAGGIASNFKPEHKLGANLWNAQSAIDGNLETAWMLPGDSPNRGEWIEFDVPKSTLDAIRIYPGWGRSEKDFNDYARVKEMKVEVFCCTGDPSMSSTWSGSVTAVDKGGWQVLDVEDASIGNEYFGGKVRLSIVDIYDGRDYPNLAISEVVLQLAEYDAAAQVSKVSSERADHMAGEMVDDDTRTYWVGDTASAKIDFVSDGFGVSSVGLTSKSKDYDRPRSVRITANDRVILAELADSLEPQFIEIPPVVGYTGSAWGDIQLEVIDVYPGGKNAGELALTELDVKATNFEGL